MYLKDWCIEFLKVYKKSNLKYSTYVSYVHSLQHIPSDLTLDCSLNDIQCIINCMRADELAYSTIKHVIVIIRQALFKAYQLGMIKNIPVFDALEMPKNNKKVVIALTVQEQQKILNVLNDNEFYYDLFLFLLGTGCRVGEALALTWNDIDLLNKTIDINKTDYRGTIQEVKTINGNRIIPITDELRLLLFAKNKNSFNNKVFGYNYFTVRDAWKRVCRQAGIPPCGLHTLRHTYATNALRNGMNIKILSSLLGHASIQITLDTYCSVTIEDKRKEAEKISLFSALPRFKRWANSF